MRIEIEFQARYTFAEPVSLSVHLYRLFPRAGRGAVIHEARFQTNDNAQVSYHRDLFDNEVASCFHSGLTSELATSLQLVLEVAERNPFAFLLAPHALELPFQYAAEEAQVLAPFLDRRPAPALPFWRPGQMARPTMDAVLALNRSFQANLTYERREEGEARTPEQTIAAGSGACRDFAVLMASSLRGLGLAARLVSGYVVEDEEAARTAEGALHEWVETYLPGAGWFGLDPTNGTVCDHRHIPAAIGLTAEQISPTHGRYFHATQVASKMVSTVAVRLVG